MSVLCLIDINVFTSKTQGTLEGVDCYMNTEVSNAHLWSIYAQLKQRQSANSDEPIVINTEPDPEFLLAQPHIDYMFIKGSRIRYFHLPKQIDIISSIETKLATYRRRRAPMERPFNWKSYRKRQKMEQLQQTQATAQPVQSTETPSTSSS